MANTLGSFAFHIWQGPPYLLTQANVITETRPGAAATNLWLDAVRAQPFMAKIISYYDTWPNAVAALATLNALASSGPLTLTFAEAVAGYQFKVLSLAEQRAEAVKASVAGNENTLEGMLSAQLTLLAVATS